ncbi:MAG: metalloregulator ArsR/SmtB family transcription factor [Candidatus Omnitrophica bacterium]|nr:metalloregulator ArsR/SmtB family transcription factor [Candidatus Omnitrophota bacterium]
MKELEKIFKALADINRLRILKMLQAQKRCVCELAFVLGIAQPSVSRHLKKLKNAGLIASEKNGFWTDYYLIENSKGSKAIMKYIKQTTEYDSLVKKDLEKIKKANRQKLCCK